MAQAQCPNGQKLECGVDWEQRDEGKAGHFQGKRVEYFGRGEARGDRSLSAPIWKMDEHKGFNVTATSILPSRGFVGEGAPTSSLSPHITYSSDTLILRTESFIALRQLTRCLYILIMFFSSV